MEAESLIIGGGTIEVVGVVNKLLDCREGEVEAIEVRLDVVDQGDLETTTTDDRTDGVLLGEDGVKDTMNKINIIFPIELTFLHLYDHLLYILEIVDIIFLIQRTHLLIHIEELFKSIVVIFRDYS